MHKVCRRHARPSSELPVMHREQLRLRRSAAFRLVREAGSNCPLSNGYLAFDTFMTWKELLRELCEGGGILKDLCSYPGPTSPPPP